MGTTRRELLAGSGLLLTIGFAGCAPGASTDPDTGPAPPVAGGVMSFLAADYPELAEVGGSVRFTVDGPGRLIITRTATDTFVCLSRKCTHQGCDVDYDPLLREYVCPCHDSTFSRDGDNLSGPADLPLASYPTDFDGTTVSITLA